MSRILVVSNTKDAHVERVTDLLLAAGHPVVRFDTDRIANGCCVSFTDDGISARPRLVVDDYDFDVSDVRSVWWRRPEPIKAYGVLNADAGAAAFIEHEWMAAVHGVLRTIDARWVSHPEALKLANHKVLQLLAARALGFRIPATCMSADPAVIREFCEHHDYKVVAKLVNAGPPRVEPPGLQYMVFTTPVTPDDLADDAALASAPAIYQAYVDKLHELRVTVVGDAVFACAIDSQATVDTSVDWRHYDLESTPHRATQLESAVRDACLALTRRFNLAFGAIDLIVTPEKEVVFLEINPNGQWGWIEDMTGLPIGHSLANLLASA